MTWQFFKQSKRGAAQEVKIIAAKQQMHQAAAHAEVKKEALRHMLERNGITLHIFRAMGGKHQ